MGTGAERNKEEEKLLEGGGWREGARGKERLLGALGSMVTPDLPPHRDPLPGLCHKQAQWELGTLPLPQRYINLQPGPRPDMDWGYLGHSLWRGVCI